MMEIKIKQSLYTPIGAHFSDPSLLKTEDTNMTYGRSVMFAPAAKHKKTLKEKSHITPFRQSIIK
jgi:hypothetical protein